MAELAAQLGHGPHDALFFFCSADYDLAVLGQALARTFDCPLIGCTGSGQIGPTGFTRPGLVGVALSGGVRVQSYLIPLTDYAARTARIALEAVATAGRNRFGLLLIDGLSMMEERLIASLYQTLGNVPIIGGSASDDLRFERTHVYDGDGRFVSGAAMFCLIDCDAPLHPFKVQHFRPGDIELVITAADPERRIIYEMNGEPAAKVYAEALGLPPAALTPEVFSSHPLVLTFGAVPYVRSIQKGGRNGAFVCYCAIEEGLIVTIGTADNPLETMAQALREVHQAIAEPVLILGSDCVMRRLEFTQRGIDADMGRLMADHRVFAFSTYGEQYNGIHVNQTFTGVAIGA
ncbi:MAG: FIST N-terminal domain-containing protein [Herbaspirillum sp.]